MPTKRSRVHPKYKTQYRVSNWPDYDKALVQRGNITLWLTQNAIDNWHAKPTKRRGGQPKYSDLAIETALTLRLLLHLPLRQAEGFLVSIFELMAVHLDVPDHTTLSRRNSQLDLPLQVPGGPGSVNLVVDSSGLAIFGEGEWAAAKHGGKGIQGWRKLHLGVNDTGLIVAQTLTNANTDDATTAIELLDAVPGNVSTLIADAAYDTRPFYAAGKSKGARVVVPPVKNAKAKRPRCAARDRTIHRVHEVGRRQWKKEVGYHRQARAENAFFRLKTIVGDRLRARTSQAQMAEARIVCNMLNRMTELGRPESYPIEK